MSRPSTANTLSSTGSTPSLSQGSQGTNQVSSIHHQHQIYAFPILKIQELLTILNELCPDMLTAADFKTPTYERILPVYERLTSLLFCTDRTTYQSTLQQQQQQQQYNNNKIPSFHEAIHSVDGNIPSSTSTTTTPTTSATTPIQPNYSDDSITQISFLKSLLDSIKHCGVYDVSLRDIIQPDTLRTKKILSGYINFARYREEKLSLYSEYSENTENLLEKKILLESQYQQSTQQLRTLQEQYTVEDALLESLNKEISELNTSISTFKNTYESLNEWIQEHTKTYNDMNGSLVLDTTTKNTLKQENERLKNLIVKEPEKFKQNIVEIQHLVTVNKHEVNDLHTTLRDATSKYQNINKQSNKLQKRIEVMNSIAESLQKFKKLQNLSKDQQLEKSKKQHEFQMLVQEEERIKDKIVSIEKQIISISKQFEVKRNKATVALQQVQHEKNQIERDIQNQSEYKESLENENLRVKREIEEIKEKYDTQIERLQEKYNELAKQLVLYHGVLFNEMTKEKV